MTQHAANDVDPSSDLALGGLRVLEVGSLVSAPFAAKLLADFGADVIKIEPPAQKEAGGDPARYHGPFPNDKPHLERSALFLALNTNKRSLTLNLDDPDGQELFRRLSTNADAIIENTLPGTMKRRGLAWPELAESNRRLVMTSVTPFGQTGPYADYQGPNLVEFATGGQMHMTGEPGREPIKNGGYMADFQSGLNAFAATAVATLGAQLHGEGDHVDVGAMQCQASVLEGAMPYWCYLGTDSSMRRGNIMASFIGLYPSADGQIGIHAMASNWAALLQTIEMPELAEDERFRTQDDRMRNNDALMSIFYTWAADKEKRAVYARAGQTRSPVAYVHDMQDLLDSPQLRARGFLRQIEHPETGPLTYAGPPFQMSATPARDGRAPLLGEHSAKLLTELGLNEAAITALRANGVT